LETKAIKLNFKCSIVTTTNWNKLWECEGAKTFSHSLGTGSLGYTAREKYCCDRCMHEEFPASLLLLPCCYSEAGILCSACTLLSGSTAS